MPNGEYEDYIKLVYDDSNVTETKPIVELLKVLAKLVLIIVIFYLLIYFAVGIFIRTLPIDKQIKLEKFLSFSNKTQVVKINKKDRIRLENVKNHIISTDTDFPRTSTLNIEIIDVKQKNAFCLPDGTIYITLPLYKLLNDEMLTFVVAHEMGHYKNKDHLMKLRKYIAANFVVIIVSALTSDSGNISDLASGVLEFENLNHSRFVEAKADLYAKNIMLGLYDSTDAAIETLKILEDKKYPKGLIVFSTHPTIEKRIKAMAK